MKDHNTYILVEGDRDKRFVQTVIKPWIEKRTSKGKVHVIIQGGQTTATVTKYISASKRGNARLIYLKDKDQFPCITSLKNKVISQYPSLTNNNIQVVVVEIESWYLAGLHAEVASKFKLEAPKDCNFIKKEKFNELIKSSKFESPLDAMIEIAKKFNLTQARTRNTSFDYFMRKLENEF